MLLDKVADSAERDWYAAQAVTNGWTRASLEHHIKTLAHQRFGTAPTNFDRLLEPGASDLAQQIRKDPYVFDFLDVEPAHAERGLERALVERIIETSASSAAGSAL